MFLLAPAKINLHLRVGPRRADGFHSLLSWFCTVGLFDSITLQRAESAEVRLSCDRADLPCDQSNLVVRVARSLAEIVAGSWERGVTAKPEGVSAVLEKRIPMGAGLGGGSSDGARTLLGLSRLWQLGWSREQLAQFAGRFGSDLPFFFHGPSSICCGRGEIVRPTPPPRPRWAVLILPPIAMPTPAVYRRFDELGLGREADITTQPDWPHWAQLDAAALLEKLVNDLEPAAFAIEPKLGQLRQDLEQALARVVRMSGSGSSLFTLFDQQTQAASAAAKVNRRHGTSAVAVPLAPVIEDDLGENEDVGTEH